jgi:hypothetical protein
VVEKPQESRSSSVNFRRIVVRMQNRAEIRKDGWIHKKFGDEFDLDGTIERGAADSTMLGTNLVCLPHTDQTSA